MIRAILFALGCAAAAACFISPATAQSAPFCLVDSAGTRCWYYDLPSCQRDAATSGGGCVVNQERSARSGGGSNVWSAFEQGARLGDSARQSRQRREMGAAYRSGGLEAMEEAAGRAGDLESMEAARRLRAAEATGPRQTIDLSAFCDRMLDHDIAILNQLGERITQEESNNITNSYVDRATYCQHLASQIR